MEASATNILAGRLDSRAGSSPITAGLLPGYWVIQYLTAPDQLLFSGGEALPAESVALAGRKGYYCAFSPLFMPERLRSRIKRLPVFAHPDEGLVILNAAGAAAVSQVFELLLAEAGSQYDHKLDLMRIYVIQIIHFGLKNAGRSF
ncbi:hypothetical protein [Dyadobacter sp. OTU695]|uniref:hypothetical protein n=1 Tax=Dyadobacter sp. OTU695 TaxID=3043860 RepID=UPI00313D652F